MSEEAIERGVGVERVDFLLHGFLIDFDLNEHIVEVALRRYIFGSEGELPVYHIIASFSYTSGHCS